MGNLKIKIGDVVQLKSGSPNMTVNSVCYDYKTCDCVYFVEGIPSHQEMMDVNILSLKVVKL